jgi:hypothetical protein
MNSLFWSSKLHIVAKYIKAANKFVQRTQQSWAAGECR